MYVVLQLNKGISEVIALKKGDLIIAVIVLAAAAVLYFSGILKPEGEGAKAVVTVDGEVFGEYDLSKDGTYTVKSEDGENTFEIKDGKVDVTKADCRDGICVNHTPVYLDGETIICLPHKVVIEIVGGEKSAVDGAVR